MTDLTQKEISAIVFCIRKQISQMEKAFIYAKIKGISTAGFQDEITSLNGLIEKITQTNK